MIMRRDQSEIQSLGITKKKTFYFYFNGSMYLYCVLGLCLYGNLITTLPIVLSTKKFIVSKSI